MRIKLLKSAIGPEGNFLDGAVLEAPAEISMRLAVGLVSGGYAVDITPPVIEEASVSVPEAAVIRRKKRS